MTTIELPNDTSELTWIYVYQDGRQVASIWGTAEVTKADDRWMIIVREGVHVNGFLFADTITREEK